MYTTRLSLMNRVKDPRDEVAWQEFYDVYKPLIYRYARGRGLSSADGEEIVGWCFEKLTQTLAEFEYSPARGKFKSWLKTLVNNKITQLQVKRGREGQWPVSAVEAALVSSDEDPWEKAWRQEVLTLCVQRARTRVSTQNYQVFRLNVYEGWSAEKIAQTLDLSVEQVYRAKHKVLKEIRAGMSKYFDE